jgi:hypothetical protein
MKKGFILLSVAIVMNLSVVKPSEALMINFTEIPAIVIKYTQVISEYMQKVLEYGTQIKQFESQGLNNNPYIVALKEKIRSEIGNYARQQLQQQIEGSKAKMVNYLEKKRQEHEKAEKLKQEKKKELVKKELDEISAKCDEKSTEQKTVSMQLEIDKNNCENASDDQKESLCEKYAETQEKYNTLTYEVDEYCERTEELSTLYDGKQKNSNFAKKLSEKYNRAYMSMTDKYNNISQKADYEFKKVNDKYEATYNNVTGKVTKYVNEGQLKLLGAVDGLTEKIADEAAKLAEGGIAKFSGGGSSSSPTGNSATVDVASWDDYDELPFPSADTYKEFLNTYFYNTEVEDSEKENKFKSYQADIEIITRTRRYLVVNTAAHLLQVAATTRREIPTRSQNIKDSYQQTSQSENELTAITAYTNTKIEAARALLLYAKLLSAKLQYQSAHKLVDIDLQKAWKDEDTTYKQYENLDLNNFIMTKEFVQSLLPKAKVE